MNNQSMRGRLLGLAELAAVDFCVVVTLTMAISLLYSRERVG